MRATYILAPILATVLATPALPLQIGPPIRIGPGEATVGGFGYKDGKVATPTPDQLLDNVINSTPLAALSDADKKNIKQAIVTTGYVAAVAADPVASLVIISVLSKDGTQRDVPIPVKDTPPTGTTWTLAASCVTQQEGDLITAMFVADVEHLSDIKRGDLLKLTAPFCEEYKEHSVTAVTIKVTGKSDVSDAAPDEFRHYVTGRKA
ncbi:hypothetical protein B5E41_30375 [Rhizobium esperanzae]|uniref:Uncharacterized protein n=1 Tax=Rhizobium esperanzae TaxID=1967781 RepID=A0A246DKJ6_9HYPH|nr:hypothetical protein [Rhizobium esperanzae]OWO89551.1 hypothetical protein B5E41_30375 [Rhizobium esperanzae]